MQHGVESVFILPHYDCGFAGLLGRCFLVKDVGSGTFVGAMTLVGSILDLDLPPQD